MPSTPTTSRPSTTPPASSWPTASGPSRSASGSPSATRRSCSVSALLLALGVEGPGRPGRERLVDAAADDRPHRHRGLGRLPARHRRPQPRRAASDPRRLPARCGAATTTRRRSRQHLNNRGFMNRILGGATRAVTKPWHMYPVGLLFGLGFDTATEVSLLVLAGGAAAFALPWYAILDAADPVRRRHEPARHDRRLLHELRLRLGVLQAGAQGLLQHHDHRRCPSRSR